MNNILDIIINTMENALIQKAEKLRCFSKQLEAKRDEYFKLAWKLNDIKNSKFSNEDIEKTNKELENCNRKITKYEKASAGHYQKIIDLEESIAILRKNMARESAVNMLIADLTYIKIEKSDYDKKLNDLYNIKQDLTKKLNKNHEEEIELEKSKLEELEKECSNIQNEIKKCEVDYKRTYNHLQPYDHPYYLHDYMESASEYLGNIIDNACYLKTLVERLQIIDNMNSNKNTYITYTNENFYKTVSKLLEITNNNMNAIIEVEHNKNVIQCFYKNDLILEILCNKKCSYTYEEASMAGPVETYSHLENLTIFIRT